MPWVQLSCASLGLGMGEYGNPIVPVLQQLSVAYSFWFLLYALRYYLLCVILMFIESDYILL